MKFLFDNSGVEAVSVEFVKKIYAKRVINKENSKVAYVAAEISGKDDDFILKEFNSDDADKNFEDAKNYLAKLIKTLNGGAK